VIRLTARFWVDAWLARLRVAGLSGYVVAHGDDRSGAVVVKCARLDGTAIAWTRRFNLLSDQSEWGVLLDGPETEVDALLTRERARDPDLWIVEVENRAGEGMLDG
jgi:hypothetical protein